MKSALNRSLHGRAIVITDVNPTVTLLHTVPTVTIDPAIVHEVNLELSNPGSGTVIAEVHYNNGAIYETVLGKSTKKINITLEGDSPACTVANPHLGVALDASSPSGSQINVMGGVRN